MKAAEGQYYLYMETSNMENETAAFLHLSDDVAFESTSNHWKCILNEWMPAAYVIEEIIS